MIERFTLEEAGYILYAEMLERLRERFPSIPEWRLDQIVTAEHDAITGGILQIVPSEVESGAIEMLEREQHEGLSDKGEVA
ncbi:hypothetical protein [Microbacterium sp. UFMG61]|jgi:hypothetical protein|uniref:hypothetical protein n=1 Tax=Microbacterium sp. UFMG61 TaxID=2745935 RepID=UPI00188E16C9|nr:hypothetical protein [Microbacterium sp. UFMG61]